MISFPVLDLYCAAEWLALARVNPVQGDDPATRHIGLHVVVRLTSARVGDAHEGTKGGVERGAACVDRLATAGGGIHHVVAASCRTAGKKTVVVDGHLLAGQRDLFHAADLADH